MNPYDQFDNPYDQFDGKVGQGQAALIGLGKGIDDMAAGIRQLTPAPIRGAIDWANNKLGLPAPPSIDPQERAADTAAIKPVQDQYPITSALAQGLPTVAAATPLGMAGMAALNYGTPEERAANAAGGYVGGKLGQVAGAGISRVLQPIRGAGQSAIDATTDLFNKYSLPTLPGQVTGSTPMRWMESTLANLPGGSRIRDIVAAQQKGLNTATMQSMGAAGDSVTPEAVQAAKGELGKVFSGIPKQETVAIDKPVADALTSVETNYYKNLSPDQRGIVKQYVDDILSYGESGMPGDVYQKARSRIAARAASTQDSELKNALTGVYKTLDGAFDASASPESVAAMKTARQQYSTAKSVEGMANITGDISPARLANAAKNLPKTAQDLSQLGAKMKSLPDSGTAQRLMWQSLLSGGVGATAGLTTGDPSNALKYGAASLAGPWVAAQALTRAPIAPYLSRGLLNVSPELERLLKSAGGIPASLLGQQLSR